MTYLGNLFAQENEEMKLSGLYLGSGVNVNYDMANVYNRDAYLNTGYVVPSDTKIVKATDLSYGIHALVGYGNVFSNKVFLGIEQQVGIAYHPCNVKNYITGEKVDSQIYKPLEFTTLVRLGYKSQSCSGMPYISAGMKVLTIDIDDSKIICRPVFGIGYQHGLSEHLSVRGDVLYTHGNSVNYKEKTLYGNYAAMKGNGHSISAMVTFAYTL